MIVSRTNGNMRLRSNLAVMVLALLSVQGAMAASTGPAKDESGALAESPQTVTADPAPATPPTAPTVVAETAPASVPAVPVAPASGSDLYSDVRIKGIFVDFPPPAGTLTGDNSFRRMLAENGIGYQGFWVGHVEDNVLGGSAGSGPPAGKQRYDGQRNTYIATANLAVVADLSRYGIPDGQIVVDGVWIRTNWTAGTPDVLTLGQLYYYQTLFNKRVEAKLGYLGNDFEFYGPYIAGNITNVIFGASGTVPAEAGLSSSLASRPGVNLTFHLTDAIYDKFGVQAASSPDGYGQENLENPSSLKWHIKNARTLLINELGYKTEPTASRMQSWYRAGYIHNNSLYTDYKNGGRATGEYAWYLMGDQQVYGFSASAPYRGLFAGFSVQRGNSEFTAIDSTYELRFYAVGPFASRPQDTYSFIIDRNSFSPYAQAASRAAGSLTHSSSTTFTLAYKAKVYRGVYAGVGVRYTNNPTPITYAPDTGSALVVTANLTFLF